MSEFQALTKKKKIQEEKEAEKAKKKAEKEERRKERAERRTQKEALKRAEEKAAKLEAETKRLNDLAENNPAEYERQMAAKAAKDAIKMEKQQIKERRDQDGEA